MSIWRGTWLRLRALFSRETVERELRDELDFHIGLETQRGVEQGLTAREARRQAMVSFGGIERFREETRRARGLDGLESIVRDVRVGIRMLRRSPAFTLTTVGTLALGIGAATTIYSVVKAVLIQPSPFPDSDRLVMVWETDRASDTSHEPASWPDVVDFAERSRTLASIGSMMGFPARVTGAEGAERVTGLAVTPGLLETLGVGPLAGRLFGADEWSSDAPSVAIMGEEFWRARYTSDVSLIGQTVVVNDLPVTIVGILPRATDLGVQQIHSRSDYSADFDGGDVAVWFPLLPSMEAYPRSTHPFLTIGRLEGGVELAVAQDELARIARELEEAYPENTDRGVNLETYSEVVFGPARAALLVLLGAVILVLLVACANVANLLLARTIARNREVALRSALGAGRGALQRQFLVEGVILTGVGTGIGILFALASLQGLLALAPSDLPRLQEARLDQGVLAVTTAVSAAVALFFGILPGIVAEAVGVHQSLKSQPVRRITEGRQVRRMRSALMVAEVGFAVLLVIGAGILLRSLWQLSSIDPGFESEGVVTLSYELPENRYPTSPFTPGWPDLPETVRFHATLLERVRALPGVESAAISANHPLDPGFTNSFVVVGREAESAEYPEIRTRFVSPGYIQTMGVPVLAGRDLSDGDAASAPAVGLINRAAAERYFGSADPVGQALRWWGITRTVVGVIGDEHFLGLDAPSAPAVYVPAAQGALAQGTLVVRVTGDPSALFPLMRGVIQELDPQVPVYDERTMTAALQESISSPRFTAAVLGTFGGVALLLALIGVHGALSHSVAQRVPEVGVRMALGAQRREVVSDVMREGLGLTAVGVMIGAGGALALSRLLESLVYGITPTDAPTYGVVIGLVVLAAAGASFFPALRASGVDPATALRAE